MYLTMFREPSMDGATLSKLFNGLDFLMDVLEDEVREKVGIPVAEWKQKTKTAIPAGKYRITLENSSRFGPDTLTLKDVEGFEYIRVHAGNTQFDTDGCLLVGERNSSNTVALSRANLVKLKALVLPKIKAGEEVWIEIFNPLLEA
jgi:hypothetical protein